MATRLSKEQREANEKSLIREYFNQRKNGFFVDVGANDPTAIISQSHHLEQILNWSGVLIEPNPIFKQRCLELRDNSFTFQCACVADEHHQDISLYIPILDGHEMDTHAGIGKNIDDFSYQHHREINVPARTLNSILEEVKANEIDLLSIDVEGAELEVLKGLDIKKYQPKLILLEDKHLYLSKHRYLKSHGYHLIKRTGWNFWYAPIGAKTMPQTFWEKFRIFKRMYLSIWLKKIKYSIRHSTLEPFKTL